MDTLTIAEIYDEKQVVYEKDQEELYHDFITNRIQKKYKHIYGTYNTMVSHIKEIIIDDFSYEVEECGATRAMLSDYDNILIFSQFFERGWQPQSIGKMDIDNCSLTSV